MFCRKVSGAYRNQPKLNRMLDQLREGDIVTVWKLDRLARSTGKLLEIFESNSDCHAALKCRKMRSLGHLENGLPHRCRYRVFVSPLTQWLEQ